MKGPRGPEREPAYTLGGLTLGERIQVVITWDAAEGEISMYSSESDSPITQSATSNSIPALQELYIGADADVTSSYDKDFDGEVHEFRMYYTAMNDAEADALISAMG
jgi:hypothetical protein